MVRLASIAAVLAGAITTASAWSIDNLDAVLLEKRQSNDPSYQCHANCGFTIQGARQPNYCTNTTWVDWFNGCMDCAIEFNIWTSYGNSVTNAAEGCGLTAEPVGLNANATASDTASASASESAAPGSTSAESAASATAESAASSASGSAASAASATSAASSATASTEASGSGATALSLSGSYAMVVLGLIAVYSTWA